MALTSGTRLGPYEIRAVIGAGGMGEVYAAHDTRLGRDVAVKVLPEAFARDASRVARFEREARAIAALSHPNIVAIFDTGIHDGRSFLVSELLHGESLGERLKAGALPVRKAVDVAILITRGLAAAHAKGVVHRDLKPENVFLLTDGQVKILDFGLAQQAPAASETTETAARVTDPGTVMGTIGYMAPEQVRGQATDARTDLFAFGAVLYEMLSGQRAFKRETAAETMTAILKDDPEELTSRSREHSPALDRIVRHCLEKNPDERFQTARDAGFALETLSGSSASGSAALADSHRGAGSRRDGSSQRVYGAIAVATVLALTAGAAAGWWWRQPTSSATFTQKTFETQSIYNARFMPDGRTIVHDAARQGAYPDVFVIRPDRLESEVLATRAALLSVASTGELAVLTDIVYGGNGFVVGTLGRMTAGAAPRAVLEQARNSADWSPDGASLAVVHIVNGRDRLEYPIGTTLFETAGALTDVRVAPDGNHVAFVDHTAADDRGIVKIVDRSGHVATLTPEYLWISGLAWTPDGATVLFSANDTTSFQGGEQIHRVGTAAGSPVTLLQQSPGGLRVYDVARSGTVLAARNDLRFGSLALAPGEPRERDVSWLDSSAYPLLSRDGRSVLFTDLHATTKNSNYSVWLRRTDGSPAQRLGEGLGFGLSPDGTRALAFITKPARTVIYPTGAGSPVNLPMGPIETLLGGSWFPDARQVLVCGNEPSHAARCYAQSLSGEPPRAVTGEGVVGLWVSPDGQQLLAQGLDRAWQVVPLNGQPAHAPKGLLPDDVVGGWSTDGRAAFAANAWGVPARLERVDLTTGTRTFLKELAPSDRSGVTLVFLSSVIEDGRGYSYYYRRWNATLYQAEGLTTAPR